MGSASRWPPLISQSIEGLWCEGGERDAGRVTSKASPSRGSPGNVGSCMYSYGLHTVPRLNPARARDLAGVQRAPASVHPQILARVGGRMLARWPYRVAGLPPSLKRGLGLMILHFGLHCGEMLGALVVSRTNARRPARQRPAAGANRRPGRALSDHKSSPTEWQQRCVR